MLNTSGGDGFLIISVLTEWTAERIFISMATHNLNKGGVPTNILHISTAIHLKILNLAPNYFLVI